jgi:hypothetical protein
MATVQQQTTQLEFHQAMADFKTMFPDMDDEVIEVNIPTLTLYVIFKRLKNIWSVITFRRIYL